MDGGGGMSVGRLIRARSYKGDERVGRAKGVPHRDVGANCGGIGREEPASSSFE